MELSILASVLTLTEDYMNIIIQAKAPSIQGLVDQSN